MTGENKFRVRDVTSLEVAPDERLPHHKAPFVLPATLWRLHSPLTHTSHHAVHPFIHLGDKHLSGYGNGEREGLGTMAIISTASINILASIPLHPKPPPHLSPSLPGLHVPHYLSPTTAYHPHHNINGSEATSVANNPGTDTEKRP